MFLELSMSLLAVWCAPPGCKARARTSVYYTLHAGQGGEDTCMTEHSFKMEFVTGGLETL